ncbi:MAG: YceH family protein [Pyrinomonadaceae bacterium]
MAENLSETEVRVLGCLVEKQLTTPEYYPLTLNALIAACNQKSNREPVVSYDETTVMRALDSLRDQNLVYVFHGSTSRVVKYKHMVPSVYELDPAETAALTVLMLRGPQTVGEIRGRTDRLYEFESLGGVQDVLENLARRNESLVVRLDRLPGQKDARYAHLLAGEIDIKSVSATAVRPTANSLSDERIELLEREVERLREQFASLSETFDTFKKQFE